MGRIIVNVMPNPDLVKGRADDIVEALTKAGVERLTSVRPGRRYYLYVDGEATPEDLEAVRQAALETLVDPKTEALTGVFIGGTHLTEDEDDWDYFESGIGAIAPIPEGAGRHEPKHVGHGPIDLARLDTAAGDPYTYSESDEDTPYTDPTPVFGAPSDRR